MKTPTEEPHRGLCVWGTGARGGWGWTRSHRVIYAFPESQFVPGERGATGEGRGLTGVGAVCRVSAPTVRSVSRARLEVDSEVRSTGGGTSWLSQSLAVLG